MKSVRKTATNQANLRQIADEAGVTMMTVSRALRGKAGVSDDTRSRILKIAQAHHYTPNRLVTGIRTGRTQTVGVMMPITQSFYAQIIAGINLALASEDYAMFCSDLAINFSKAGEAADARHLMALIERRVDGLIFRPTDDGATDSHFEELRRRKIPFVTVDRLLTAAHCDFVGTDDYGGGAIAAKHLLALGHRHVGHLAGPNFVSTSRQRRQGFEDAIRDAGAKCTTLEMPDFGDYETARTFLNTKPRPSAIFCANDPTAVELYRAARELGLSIPNDISVVGFADLPETAVMWPGLTTIRQDSFSIGVRAARLLLHRISDNEPNPSPEIVQMATTLVVRESTIPLGP